MNGFILPLLLILQVCNSSHVQNGRFLAHNPSFLSPLFDSVASILSGDGLVEGTLGALKGVLNYKQEFDYVVVGGGTAGSAIGVRLAEAGFRVAIVEAGLNFEIAKPILSTTPGGATFGIGSNMLDSMPTVDWEIQTVPQSGANNRTFHYTQGKCLGGSSALNLMVHHRGCSGSYDRWAEQVGDDTYRLDSFLEFFKKSVSFTPPNHEKRKANASTPYNVSDFEPPGHGGPVQVGYPNWVTSWSTWLEKGLSAVGMRRTEGFNNGSLLGYHYAQTTIRSSDATRSSSVQYIYTARDKNQRNLKVFTGTQATKILFDKNKMATGVGVDFLGLSYTIKAKKEVILSAGAFHSPQLLMLSGVGKPESLRKFNITVLSALSGVGQNMWDHIFFGPSYAVNFPTIDAVLHNPVSLASAVTEYVTKAGGPLSSNHIDFVGWEKLPKSYHDSFSPETKRELSIKFPDDWPEVEYLAADGYMGDFNWPILQQPLNGKQYATIIGAIVAPTSRGNVTLKSASAFDKPSINPNWLTTRTDQEVAVALYRRLRDIWKTSELQSITIGEEFYPGREANTDEEILEVIRNSLMTVWHPSCTCKMGKKEDAMAVVDNLCRVFGVQRLRVVDASALPLLPPGHPQTTIYALAEKIADNIIRGDAYRNN